MSRYSMIEGQLAKNTEFISCPHSLAVPIYSEDSISFNNTYTLRATINHSGSLTAGHYWAYVKDEEAGVWYSCDDKNVKLSKESCLNNKSAYVLFYVRSF